MYEAQLARYRASVDEPQVDSSNPRARVNELEQLAAEAPDTGQLSEPLADSVLQYTLRRLKPNSSAGPTHPPADSKTLYPDELDQWMNEASYSGVTSQRAYEAAPTSFEDNSTSRMMDHDSSDIATRAPTLPPYADWVNNPLLVLDQNPSFPDGLFDLDSDMQEPPLLYEDIFNFNNQVG